MISKFQYFYRPGHLILKTIICMFTVQFLFPFLGISKAGVTVSDSVSVVKQPIRLAAVTKGRIFTDGGRLVRFHVDGKDLGMRLSGGDGYAFLKYIPSSTGLKKVNVISGDDEARALLLVVNRSDRIIMVELETALIESLFNFNLRSGARDAIETLSKKYRLIYLTSLIGIAQSKKWLGENKIRESVILKWEGAEMLSDLRDRGVNLFAIVASPEILEQAAEIEKRYSFRETDNGASVDSWDDLMKVLKLKNGKITTDGKSSP